MSNPPCQTPQPTVDAVLVCRSGLPLNPAAAKKWFHLQGIRMKRFGLFFVSFAIIACGQGRNELPSRGHVGRDSDGAQDKFQSSRQPKGTGGGPKRDTEWSVSINSAAFSPDGKYLLTFYVFDGRPEFRQQFPKILSLWDLSTGKERWSLKDNDYSPYPFAFLPNAKQILLGSDDGLKVLNARDGTEVRRFEKELKPPGCLAVSPDGKLALTGTGEGDLKLWDTASGKAIYILQTGTFCHVAFSPNGKLMMAAGVWPVSATGIGESDDPVIWVWEVAKRELLVALKRSEGWLGPVAFSPDSKLAVASKLLNPTREYALVLWEACSAKPLRSFPEDFASVVAFTADGKGLLAGNPQKSQLALWNVVTGKEEWRADLEGTAWPTFAFSPDGKLAFTAQGRIQDGWGSIHFTIWDATTGKRLCMWNEGRQ
jgi:WD40 repeat protein